jgi:HSP20 family protein
MTRTVRCYSPQQDLENFGRQVDRLFGNAFRGTPFQMPSQPSTDVSVGDDEAILEIDAPGLDPESIDITVLRRSITVKAERPAVELAEGRKWLLHERSGEGFERTIALPFEVDAQSAEATYDNGVLRLVVHRPEESKPRKVTVKKA